MGGARAMLSKLLSMLPYRIVRAIQKDMAKCFCGCGRTVNGLGPRDGNKIGQKSVGVPQRLRLTAG